MTKFIFTDLMDIVKSINIFITMIQKKQEHQNMRGEVVEQTIIYKKKKIT